MTSLFPPRESLVVTSRLGTGNSRTFFLRCTVLVAASYPNRIKERKKCTCVSTVGAMKTVLTPTYFNLFKPSKCSFCHSSRTQKPQVHGERLIRGVTPVTDTVHVLLYRTSREQGRIFTTSRWSLFYFIKQFLPPDWPLTPDKK
jgi:hypothetical protein